MRGVFFLVYCLLFTVYCLLVTGYCFLGCGFSALCYDEWAYRSAPRKDFSLWAPLKKRITNRKASTVIMAGYAFDAGSLAPETTFTSEAVTRGVRVKVISRYSATHSQPHFKRWFFLYTVYITNESPKPVRLISRHWIIEDATGTREEVRGPGVVGEQPVLAPGQSFEYTSGCPLSTSFGSMRGTYQMVTEDQEMFDAEIAPFTLSEPTQVH